MSIEFVSYFDDSASGLESTNQIATTNLIKRCLIKGIIKKESFETVLVEINEWDGKKI